MKWILALLLGLFVSGCVVYADPDPVFPDNVVYYEGYYGYWQGGVFIRVHPEGHWHYYHGRYYYHHYYRR